MIRTSYFYNATCANAVFHVLICVTAIVNAWF